MQFIAKTTTIQQNVEGCDYAYGDIIGQAYASGNHIQFAAPTASVIAGLSLGAPDAWSLPAGMFMIHLHLRVTASNWPGGQTRDQIGFYPKSNGIQQNNQLDRRATVTATVSQSGTYFAVVTQGPSTFNLAVVTIYNSGVSISVAGTYLIQKLK